LSKNWAGEKVNDFWFRDRDGFDTAEDVQGRLAFQQLLIRFCDLSQCKESFLKSLTYCTIRLIQN
jgi:hypothetical protein